MTLEEITKLKTEIDQTISECVEKAFIGQSMAEVSTAVIKSHLTDIMKDLLIKSGHRVIDLFDWDVTFVSSVANVVTVANIVMQPKDGLSNEDYAMAINFLFNQEFY